MLGKTYSIACAFCLLPTKNHLTDEGTPIPLAVTRFFYVSLPLEGKGDRRQAVDEVFAERLWFAQSLLTPTVVGYTSSVTAIAVPASPQGEA